VASLLKREGTYYLQWCVSGHVRRRSLMTGSLQVAREHQRQFESARVRGLRSPLPTRTPISSVVQRYVTHMRTIKTAKSAQTDTYYLREAFGPICEALRITSRRVNEKCRKRTLQPDAQQDLRVRPVVIEAEEFEAITSAQISAFLSSHTRSRGLAPKTANRYREILVRLFNWAQKEGGVCLPGGINPAASVERYQERAPQIRFLTLPQIQQQLDALKHNLKVQTMIAMLIYAGLRREELLWLTRDDIDLTSGVHGIIRVRAKTVNGNSWQPKTKCNRAVPISSTLRSYLDRYTPQKSGEGWYFPSPAGKWWDPDNFASDLRNANTKVNLPWSCLDYRAFHSVLVNPDETGVGGAPQVVLLGRRSMQVIGIEHDNGRRSVLGHPIVTGAQGVQYARENLSNLFQIIR
jgi:integrase